MSMINVNTPPETGIDRPCINLKEVGGSNPRYKNVQGGERKFRPFSTTYNYIRNVWQRRRRETKPLTDRQILL